METFKTWRHYLEGYKYEVFVITNHNNLWHFMDSNNLSSKQVCCAQKLSWYYFQIDYGQEKGNVAVDSLFRYLWRSQAKEEMLKDENTLILHYLPIMLTKASIAELSLPSFSRWKEKNLSPFHRVFICETHV